ncbi:MAG: TrmH family RNA methyltransferase [Caldilineaceae bacterium]|nr:TrmH family RNA methyltransferase [Caldilineaceae bacterium]
MSEFVFRRCQNSACGLRYPAPADDPRGAACPRCGGVTVVVATAAGGAETGAAAQGRARNEPRIAALIDNVRSLYNVGSFLRTADGAGLTMLHLCGITPTPANPKLGKTALGAEEAVAWRYHADAVRAAALLQQQGQIIVALETTPGAVSLFDCPGLDHAVLVVGNERAGIDPGILELADLCVAIPMAGVKRSLNVATAFGIAAYALTAG